MIEVPDFGSITLAVDNLNDITKYATVNYPIGTFVDGDPTLYWYSHLNDPSPSNPEKEALDELRIKEYTRTIAHEMSHIQFKLENTITALKWDLLRELGELEGCVPAKNGDNSDDYCSTAPGHEFSNQDGFDSCEVQESYPEAVLNNIPD